jgi:hypothetical protein
MDYLTISIGEIQSPEIVWNHEELKTELTEVMKDHTGVAYTEEKIPEAKKELANLRKLLATMESARRDVKKKCLEPYEKFETQYKEVKALVDEPICTIDAQVKEYEYFRKEEKRKKILEMFDEVFKGLPVDIDHIWNEKWLNVSSSLKDIREELEAIAYRIQTDLKVIEQLPEFSFEAKREYTRTLDWGKTLVYVEQLKEDARLKAEEEARKAEKQEIPESKKKEINLGVLEEQEMEEPRQTVLFEAFLNSEEARCLVAFCKQNHIRIKVIKTKE